MESAERDTEDESREKPHPVPPSVQEGSSNLLREKGDDCESKENLGPNSSCLQNPYVSGGRLTREETMTLEFVAVMSKKNTYSERTSKICVAFYKQPGQYQEFAVLAERKKRITGSAMIPISDLQRGPIFYKYAIINNVLSTDCEMRTCDLEHIYGTESRNVESQLHRVLSIPKEEIKAGGTWTIFENMKCHFNEKKNYFKSKSTMPQKSVNCGIIEYLSDEFLWIIRLQKGSGFKYIERKLKIYTESFKIYLGDAAEGEPYSPTDLTHHVLHDNMIKFMDKIIEYLESEEHQDDGLLFALYTSSCYNIPLSKDVIIKAEKLFQNIGPFQGKFKHLRGKRNYIEAVKKICFSNKDITLCIWLIPLLYAITEKMEDPFFPQFIPSKQFLQLRDDEKMQRWV